MEELLHIHETFPWFFPAMAAIAAWDFIWKLFALWRSAQKKQVAWFICLAVTNTVGILPIIYLLTHKSKS